MIFCIFIALLIHNILNRDDIWCQPEYFTLTLHLFLAFYSLHIFQCAFLSYWYGFESTNFYNFSFKCVSCLKRDPHLQQPSNHKSIFLKLKIIFFWTKDIKIHWFPFFSLEFTVLLTFIIFYSFIILSLSLCIFL